MTFRTLSPKLKNLLNNSVQIVVAIRRASMKLSQALVPPSSILQLPSAHYYKILHRLSIVSPSIMEEEKEGLWRTFKESYKNIKNNEKTNYNTVLRCGSLESTTSNSSQRIFYL